MYLSMSYCFIALFLSFPTAVISQCMVKRVYTDYCLCVFPGSPWAHPGVTRALELEKNNLSSTEMMDMLLTSPNKN